MTRVAALVRKEFLELRQMPQLLRLVFVAPVLQLTLMGYAATTDIHHVPVVVVDGDRSAASRSLLGRLAMSAHFEIVEESASPAIVEPALAAGRAWLAIVIPAGFGDALESDAAASDRVVQILADGTDANSSGVALAYMRALVSDFNAERAQEAGRPDAVAFDGRVRVWFNAELVSRNFMVPGVLALLLMLITTNLTAMAVVREREMGTLDQLYVTPLAKWELIIGKLVPYGVIGLVDVALVLAVAIFWFEVPLRGSLTLLWVASAIYLVCTLGLGLLVSTISRTQQQAMMTSVFFFLVPMIYLSGFIFPIENMPQVIQAVTTLVPLRYFLVIVRGIFLKGVGFDILWPQFAALGAWGIAVVGIAMVRARKRG